MKIAYISDYSPLDINTWSGTPYYVYQTLSQKHTVVWIGKDLFRGAYWYHKFNNKRTPFYPHDYSPEICHLLSEEINAGNFDLVITSQYLMISCLNVNIPIVGTAVPISPNRFWVDWFWCTQFVVLFSNIFPKILAYEFRSTDTADGVLSKISNNIQILYPPISKQKNYDYSDIMPHPSQSSFQNNLF